MRRRRTGSVPARMCRNDVLGAGSMTSYRVLGPAEGGKMAKIAVWEFEGGAVFNGRNMFAEVGPRPKTALTSGTLELTATCRALSQAVIVANGVPEIHTGAFEITLSEAGAVAIACSNGGVEPARAATSEGFVDAGDELQITLSWGDKRQFTVVNKTRLETSEDGLGTGFAAQLPLWMRVRIVPGAPLTFGAAHRGNPPYFHGTIARVTLSDTADAPSIAPPAATVHRIHAHRQAPVVPRRPVTAPRQGNSAPGGQIWPGVFVSTAEGEKPVGELKIGDLILTRERGLQPLRWIAHASLDWAALRRRPHLRPVVVRKGALGQGLPEADLVLPPHHRLASRQGGHEMLLNAHVLLGAKGIYEADALGVRYTHLLFDQSELILRNGVWVEAFNPADPLRGGPFDAQRSELYELFPGLRLAVFAQAGRNADLT